MLPRGFRSNSRLYLVGLLVLGSLGAVAYRLVDLHVLKRGHFLAQIHDTRHRVVAEQARRGDIYDARGDLLATTKTDLTLIIDPWDLVNKIDALRFPSRQARYAEQQRVLRGLLAAELDMTAAELEAFYIPNWREVKLEDDIHDGVPDGRIRERYVKLRENVSEEQFARIRSLRLPDETEAEKRRAPPVLAGLAHERRHRRVYPHRELAAHVIGFVNKLDDPSGGVEAFADTYLRALAGWREIERDGKRVELVQYRQREVPSSDGWSVTLSIDAAVQYIVEQELAALVERFKPERATIIVSDPHTGFLLALANFPSFDLNEFGTTPMELQRNIAATDLLEPGSTFKIVALAGALNEGLVTPATKFDCTLDSIVFKGRPRRFMPDTHRYPNPLTLTEVIAKSSNVGTAQVGMLLGEQKLYDYARAFGFGERSGYPLGYEATGLLADPAKWSGTDITRIPAGYAIAATPLQIHYGMGVIASGGHLLRPQIIREVRDAQGEPVYTFRPTSRRTVVAPATARSMAEMLQQVVSVNGTARVTEIPGYEVAGKTGTAQKVIDGRRYSNRDHIGSFSGFFPSSRPRVLMTVVVDNGRPPNGGTGYGSVVAAPSFKRIAEQLIPYLDIKPAGPAPALLAGRAEGGAR